jgi:hypothetical protein
MNNFCKELEKLDHKKIMDFAKMISTFSNEPIFINYFYLLDFVKRNIAVKDGTTLIGISHTVYGWMPRMLLNTNNNIISNINEVNTIWKNISSGSLDHEFLSKISQITNNSIRGGSKLLHFINPKHYAIFDSHVFKAITNKDGYDYDYSINNFIMYINRLKELEKNDIRMEELRMKINKDNNIIRKDITNLRYIEMCLYYSQKNIVKI